MTQASRVLVSRKNTESNKRHVRDLRYSGWQKPYLDAMLEMNPDRLKDRVASAEAAIQLRLRELADSPDSQAERQCLADARNGLLVLKKETSAPPSNNHGASSRVSSPLPGMK
jgi:hypothetical protein